MSFFPQTRTILQELRHYTKHRNIFSDLSSSEGTYKTTMIEETCPSEAEYSYRSSMKHKKHNMDVRNNRFFCDEYGRRMTPLGTSARRSMPELDMPTNFPKEHQQPIEERREGTNRAMEDFHAPNLADRHVSEHSNKAVCLIRRSAVKQTSTRVASASGKRNDSKVFSRVPSTIIASHTLSIAQSSPFSRRFSFDQDSGIGLSEPAGSSDARNTTTGPFPDDEFSVAAEFEDVSLGAVLVGQVQQRYAKIHFNFSDPGLPRQADIVQQEFREEMEPEKLQRRYVPTTFEEMLGEMRVPTAML
ncbi:hypothetical protein EJ02DRAFT_2749 [Clathrospora elynae]|uniref:Uncharacterized protein n=1 Tax=Clathrospora elynae TaxID=706981 RepID=A0A6A5T7N3_9PLEO|nr:hypothetical protein EJ02DRAFT_2749 [Clathrospora elynae]